MSVRRLPIFCGEVTCASNLFLFTWKFLIKMREQFKCQSMEAETKRRSMKRKTSLIAFTLPRTAPIPELF